MATMMGCLVACGWMTSAAVAADVRLVRHPPSDTRTDLLPAPGPPLVSTRLVELPLGAVRPRGWLRKQLQLQASGFHGHLGEISRFLVKKNNAWLSPDGNGDHGWEEVPYWLKGYLPTAYLLQDPEMIKEARVWIEGALNSTQPDGWFGPRQVRATVRSTQGKFDLWANMVMLFCLQSYYEVTQDRRVLEVMERYFRRELEIPESEFLPPYWQQQRAADNLYSVLWLYCRRPQPWLLELADKIHRHTANWTADVANWHNVNMSQAFGGPTTYFIRTGRRSHWLASYRNYSKIRRMYGQVPGGMFGGDENCRPGFTGPRQAIETCGMVEMMLSTELLANITGDVVWADRCEDVAFNSLPAALTADFHALRYLTAPNMPLSDAASKSPGVQNGGPMFLMDPKRHRCCQHNVGHGWPYFISHCWSATQDRGVAALLYGPTAVTLPVADGTRVTFREDTRYPFDANIKLTCEVDQPADFPLYLRVPGWCAQPELTINDSRQDISSDAGRKFIRIQRRWSDGDQVVLRLPMLVKVRRWAEQGNAVSVDRGPLTYSLEIGEKYVQADDDRHWPAFEIHPTTPWNFGWVPGGGQEASDFSVEQREWPESDMPFTLEGVPIRLHATGRRIPQWQLDHLGLVGKLQPSPVFSDQPDQPITLVPMGAARLRIASIPVIGTGPDAHHWKAPPRPRDYRVTASHCWPADTVAALCDRRIPTSSGDHSIPRLTWWDHRGSSEWVQYEFKTARRVSGVRVYWFDDAPRGHCRPPAAWSVSYADEDGTWQTADLKSDPTKKLNRFNQVEFGPVTTAKLRLEVQLQPDWSGGILEWEVLPPDDAEPSAGRR